MMRHRFNLGVSFALGFLVAACSVSAQQAEPAGVHSAGATTAQTSPRMSASKSHKFWDQENLALFAGVTAARALDFTSTQHFRERGVNEILLTNGMVDNKPLFAGIEAAGVAASIGLSYWLHHTGHHRAERWVSVVHIGVATFGDIRNYGLKNSAYTGVGP
jgi:hypothetical protein